ncbi:MAG: chorismate-binding protein [Bacteroidales bacterium]
MGIGGENIDNGVVLAAIAKGVQTRSRFYAYRLPSCEELNFGAEVLGSDCYDGFRVEPFIMGGDYPSIFIKRELSAQQFMDMDITTIVCNQDWDNSFKVIAKDEYMDMANDTIQRIKSGDFSKVVLSRLVVENTYGVDWSAVFSLLMAAYTGAFLFIFNSEESGLWIGASPELLLKNSGNGHLSTMALAGTRVIADSAVKWDEKNITEQRMVADYVADQFREVGLDSVMTEAYNRRAGAIEHICNDFIAENATAEQITDLLAKLHPTPALAGIPTAEVIDYLLETEVHRRGYYGGYIGYTNGAEFEYYVNLRSVQVGKYLSAAYVGGGLTADSSAESEWDETTQKSRSILKFLV